MMQTKLKCTALFMYCVTSHSLKIAAVHIAFNSLLYKHLYLFFLFLFNFGRVCNRLNLIYVLQHCGHTTTAIWVSSLISVFKFLSHHVQFLHLITDKRPKMLGFRLIFVHQIHIVSFSFKIISKVYCLMSRHEITNYGFVIVDN